MKSSCLMLGIIACWSAAAVAELELPKRKPGLWEMTMEMAQMPKGMKSTLCIDENTDAENMRQALAGKNGNCNQLQYKKTAKGYEADFQCSGEYGNSSGHSVITGDFNRACTMQNDFSLDQSTPGKKEMHHTAHYTYLGACPGDMKPGDMKINGMRISKETVQQGIKSAGKINPNDIKKLIETMRQQQH